MNIAIDGPGGAGKSTAAKNLAKELGFVYLDTGAMYRAVGLKVYSMGLKADDEASIKNIIDEIKIDIVYSNGVQNVLLDGVDVSSKIREHHISKYASDVSKLRCVRLKLVELQRQISKKSDTVLDGRDIGTFVLPNAEFKFYLTASLDERAKRRYLELKEKGIEMDFETVKKDIADRDFNDMNRDFAPLKKAEDSIEIDSTNLSADEAAKTMLKIIRGRDFK